MEDNIINTLTEVGITAFGQLFHIFNPPLGVEVQPTNAKESQVNITRPSMREKYIRCIRYKTLG